MKKKRIFAGILAMMMSVSVLFTAEINTKAEEGKVASTYSLVSFGAMNIVGLTRPLTDEDLQVVEEVLEADLENNGTCIISEESLLTVDWMQSELQTEDIWESDVEAYWFTRDEFGKLILEDGYTIGWVSCCKDNDGNKDLGVVGGDYWNFFLQSDALIPPLTPQYTYTPNWEWVLEMFEQDRMPDLIHVKAWYDPIEFDMYGNMTWGHWTGSYYIVDKENMVFNFETQLGDTDGNGVVDADDALAILKYKANIALTVFVLEAGDVDDNGVVDADDALTILKFKVGLLDENFQPKS